MSEVLITFVDWSIYVSLEGMQQIGAVRHTVQGALYVPYITGHAFKVFIYIHIIHTRAHVRPRSANVVHSVQVNTHTKRVYIHTPHDSMIRTRTHERILSDSIYAHAHI